MELPLAPLLALLTGSAVLLPAQSLPQWRYTEELRLGSEDDDATGFSDIRGLVVTKSRNTWVLEASLQEIRVFSPEGKLLKTVGRKGSGPGEFVYADGMAAAPDGLIWVHDPQNARFSIFDQEGRFVRQQLAPSNGYGFVWRGGIDNKGRIWDRIYFRDPKDPDTERVRRASPDWTKVDTLRVPKCQTPGGSDEASYYKFPNGYSSVPFFPGPVITTDYDTESIWCAPKGSEYRLVRVGMARLDTTARLTGKAEPVPVTALERDSAIAPLKRRWENTGGPAPDYSRIPKVKPLLQGAFIDSEGRLWVRRGSIASVASFDIWSAEGRPIATLQIPHPVNNWVPPTIRNGVIWFLTQAQGEIPYVVRARFEPAR